MLSRRHFIHATAAAAAAGRVQAAPPPDRCLVLVLVDGVRWQEVFAGAADSLLNKESGGVADPAPLKQWYGRGSPKERRENLMPFFWRTMAQEGQILGNRSLGSAMQVLNPHHFSYPGYGEMITGYADSRIDSNNKIPNPNVTLLEWLNQKPELTGRVAVFASWDVVPFIVNRERSGLFVNYGRDAISGPHISERQRMLNSLKAELPPYLSGSSLDGVVAHSAIETMRQEAPAVVWITLGEPDEWAHARRYDLYLHSIRSTDRYLQQIYDLVQAHPRYRGRTTLMVGTDHGRGRSGADWTSHGASIPGAGEVWFAALGPYTPALGEIKARAEVNQSQIAATAARALGYDYRAAVPRAGAEISGMVSPDLLR